MAVARLHTLVAGPGPAFLPALLQSARGGNSTLSQQQSFMYFLVPGGLRALLARVSLHSAGLGAGQAAAGNKGHPAQLGGWRAGLCWSS